MYTNSPHHCLFLAPNHNATKLGELSQVVFNSPKLTGFPQVVAVILTLLAGKGMDW